MKRLSLLFPGLPSDLLRPLPHKLGAFGGYNKEERSGIQGLFTGVMAKVLDFLLTFERFDYSKEEIARNSEID